METSDVSHRGNSSCYHYTYVLFSLKDRGLYIGHSQNMKQRLSQHRNGEVYSTKNRRPLKLIFCEMFINKQDAQAREEFLKSGFGRRQLNMSLKHTMCYLKKQAGSPDSIKHELSGPVPT